MPIKMISCAQRFAFKCSFQIQEAKHYKAKLSQQDFSDHLCLFFNEGFNTIAVLIGKLVTMKSNQFEAEIQPF